MPQRRPMAAILLALATMMLASACVSQTRLAAETTTASVANPTPIQVRADPARFDVTTPSTDEGPQDDVVPFDDDSSDDDTLPLAGQSGADLTEYDRGDYQVSVPSNWLTMSTPEEVEPILAAAEADGMELPRQAVDQFVGLLRAGDAIVALDFNGDNINVFRQWGPASLLVEHELIVEQMELQLAGAASNVDLSSQALMMGENPGVLIEGTYELEGQPVSLYQFSTHDGSHLYYLTVTLMSGPDRDLAIDIFRTLQLG